MPDGARLTPAEPLKDGEAIVDSFRADRAAYLRDNAWLAAIAMAAGMAILWATGNPHVWAGAIGGLAAIAIRGWYMASEELAVRWDLTDRRLLGPFGRVAQLRDIERVNRFFSVVQVVTRTGDKHLIKYQSDAAATQRKLQLAAGMLEQA
ncbi:MAG: hypothetical protein QNJ44_06460 [Rhodobacter sp.]|nr:hypothetical protein [Rhodobacter sp.]